MGEWKKEHDVEWYVPPQPQWPAAIRLEDKHDLVIDGENLRGENFQGFGIFLSLCKNITIKRSAISGFYYAVYAIDCENIVIENDCDLSSNFNRPETGWIIANEPIYQGDYFGWGGGIYFRNVRSGAIRGAKLGNQFNGADLVDCAGVSLAANKIIRTANYAVHLWGSQDCQILDNDCRWAIRSIPGFIGNTADSAAILIEGGSHRNEVVRNDLRYSGDGLFVRDLTCGSIPNNGNYIAHNNCSHSPNNAIEIVFSQGNILEGNEASFSNYGMWLDFSTDLSLLENIVEQNESEGIHVKLGSFREFAENRILKNPKGVVLLDTDPSPIDATNIFEKNGANIQQGGS